MSSSLILIVACAVVYCLGTYFVRRSLRAMKYHDQDREAVRHSEYTIRALVALVIVLHGILLQQNIFSESGIKISLGLAVSMAGWVSVALYFCISLFKRTFNLGIIVLPIGLFALLVGAGSADNAFPIDPIPHNRIPQGMGWHIALAIPAYGVLSVAFAQACLLIMQDRLLHKPNPGNRLPAFPAIQTMDANLFWLTLSGFVLMSANLVIGMAANLKNFGALLDFNHHIVFSILAWFCFACLLLGRKIAGWRGQAAAKWTIAAFGILVLAYFGTRFVNELLLSG